MASPDPAVGATELVAAVVLAALPSDWDVVYLGGFPTGRSPNRAAAVSPAGGALPQQFTFGRADPFYLRGRCRVLLRDRNRDGSDDWRWLRDTANRLHSRLSRVQANGLIRYDETLGLSRDVFEVATSTFGPDIWFRISTPPSFIQYGTPGAGSASGPRLNLIEMSVEVTWLPDRVRPFFAALGPWSPASLPVLLPDEPAQAAVVRTVEVGAGGGQGRVLAGGQAVVRAVPRRLPADERVPPSVGPGAVLHATPLADRADGLLWVNANIATESSRGVLNLFAQDSGNVVTATRGQGGGPVRIDGAYVIDGPPMRLRIVVSGYFDAAAEMDFAILLQDKADPPARYVFRLRDGVRANVSGDETYTFDWTAEKAPDPGDQWDWSAVDLTRFRLQAVDSRPPDEPRYRIRWRPRWSADDVVGERVYEGGDGVAVFPALAGERPAGGSLEQVVSVESIDDPPITRGREYAVAVSGVSGCVVWGEFEPAVADANGAPADGRHFHSSFSEDFG